MGQCFSRHNDKDATHRQTKQGSEPPTSQSQPSPQRLPLISHRDRLQQRLPVFGIPTVDFRSSNDLTTLYVCEYENGTEYTLLFLDEDRPNRCEDCFYDAIRRPLFGRKSDIETFFLFHKDEKVMFPGCYSADQKWDARAPHHQVAELPLSGFESTKDGSPVIYVNTWNHLLGNVNNNATKLTTVMVDSYILRYASRAEVDACFHGVLTTVSEVVTTETATRLGPRRSAADIL